MNSFGGGYIVALTVEVNGASFGSISNRNRKFIMTLIFMFFEL